MMKKLIIPFSMAAALMVWNTAASQVLNDNLYNFRAIVFQWRSTGDFDTDTQVGPFTTVQKEENASVVHINIGGQRMTEDYCHTWSADNKGGESDHTNITLGTLYNTPHTSFQVRGNYWENDREGNCEYNGDGFIADGDDGYTVDATFNRIFDYRAQPQLDWHYYDWASHGITGTSETMNIRVKTLWNYANGNTMDEALDFGSLPPNTTRSHVNLTRVSPDASDGAEDLAYTNDYRFASRDVVYKFDLREALDVNISLNHPETDFDTYLWLLDEQRTQIASNDDAAGTTKSIINYNNLCPGTYYVIVEGYTANEGEFKISVSTGASKIPAPTASEWTVTTYQGTNPDISNAISTGYFTFPEWDIKTSNFYDGASNYNTITNYQSNGCNAESADDFVHVYRRHLPNQCGKFYSVTVNSLDDLVEVYVDGTLQWSSSDVGCNQNCGTVWSGLVNAHSLIEIRHVEYGGTADLDINVSPYVDDNWRVELFINSMGSFIPPSFNWRPENTDYVGDLVPNIVKNGNQEYASFHYDRITPRSDYLYSMDCDIGTIVENWRFTRRQFEPGVYRFEARGSLQYASFYVNGQLYSTPWNITYINGVETPISNDNRFYWSHNHQVGGGFYFLDETSEVSFLVSNFTDYEEKGFGFVKVDDPGLTVSATQSSTQPCVAAGLNGRLSANTSSLKYRIGGIQWQRSTDNVNWTDIPGATSVDYLPGPISQTTYFRYALTSTSGEKGAYSQSHAITINQPDPNEFGNNQWIANVYDGSNFDNYNGRFTLNTTSIDLANALGNDLNSPQSINGYSGCDPGTDYWSVSFKRTNWDCGQYDFHLAA